MKNKNQQYHHPQVVTMDNGPQIAALAEQVKSSKKPSKCAYRATPDTSLRIQKKEMTSDEGEKRNRNRSGL